MITPVLIGFNGIDPRPFGATWAAMNDEAGAWFERVAGCAPRFHQPYIVTTNDAPADPLTSYPPTYDQAMALSTPMQPVSAVGLGVASSGYGGVQGCLVSERTMTYWGAGIAPRSQLWLLLHELGHVAGLPHPYGVWSRADTIMGYASTAIFEHGEDVGFTQRELAVLRTSPLWREESPMLYPFVTQRPGPDHKRWPDTNARLGVILHSMEGYEGGAWSQLDGPDIPAAWHFSVMQDGRVFQHYPLDQSPWHAGTKRGNITLIGVEHEGVAGEPLTVAQREASVALVRWIAQTCNFTMSRDPGARTLWEHHEVSFATTCPNGRIPWEYYAAQEQEDNMEVRALDSGETIAAAEQIHKRFGAILFDTAGETMVEVTDPAPPAGYRTVQVTFKEA